MKNLIPTAFITLLWVNVHAQSFADPNFSLIPVISGWTEPVGAAFSKDGEKIFVWEKAGMLYVCNKSGSNYVKQATEVIDLSAEVLNWRDHGLMGFALDPDYATNGFVYLLYVVDRRVLMNDNSITADEGHDATIARLTRYRLINSGGNLIADASSRTILIGESPSTGIPVVHEAHVVGCLAFAADGTLLVSTGDAASYYTLDAGSDNDTYWDQALQDGILRPAENVGAFRSQIVNCHNGKLLRIDPATGNGISSNPFYSAAEPRAPKSRVWALGFRNAFRMLVKPGTGSTNRATGDIGEVYVADVGWSTWEEFSIITAPGMNCGWPIYEGHQINTQYNTSGSTKQNLDEPNPLAGQSGCTRTHFTFRELIKDPTADENKTINNPCNSSIAIGTGNRFVHRRPALDFKHEQESARVGIFSGNNAAVAEIGTVASGVVGTPFAGNCALAGVWYTGNNFPPEFKNTFLLLDNTARWIKRITIDYTDVVTRVDNFVSVLGNIVTAAENPLDGTLFFVDITANSLKKIVYGGNQPPVAKITANVVYGSSPLTVNFTGNTSFDLSPGGSIASYSWNFGGGSPGSSTSANPSNIVFTDATGNPKKFVVKLTVTDNGGATDLDSFIISVNNTPPVVNITSPVKNSTYTVGGDAVYPCTATVTDAQHSGSQLKYEWQTFLRHNSHEHPEPIDNNISPGTRISRVGCNGDNYYWMVRLKVTDAAGLTTVDSSKIFPNCGGDNIPPVASSVTPANGATGININTTASATFNEAVDAATVTNTNFQMRDAGNNIIPASVNTSVNQITLTPSSALAGSTVHTATIKGGSTGVKDLAGNALASDYSWSFTTVVVDNIPPTVTSVSPVNGTTGVSTNTTVIANFSEVINATTVTAATFQLRDAGSNLIGGTLNPSSAQVTFTPASALTGSMVYTATIMGGGSGVKDVAGNALAGNYSWSFTTIDNTAPIITSVLPGSGATGISVGTTVTANFNEAINGSTVTASTFQLRNSSGILVSATIGTAGNQITLTPIGSLSGFTIYTATIQGGTTGVKDLAGNAQVSDFVWSFTTVLVDNIPPTITTVSPPEGTTGVNVNATVIANFNEAIDVSTLNSSTFQLRNAGNNLIAGTLNTSSAQVTFTPSSALSGSTIYTATVQGGISGVKDLAGNALANDYIWSFTTVAVDNTAPIITSVLPLSGASTVSVGTTVTASFGEAIDASTVSTSTFELRNSANTLMSASVNTSGNQVILTPSETLAGSAVYTATLRGGASGIKDLAGNALAEDYSWSFTTVDVDNIPPTVTSVSPVNGTTGALTNTAVIANFSETINASTVTGTNFQLRDAGNNLIAGTLNTSSAQVTFTPSSALAGLTVYTFTIQGGASGVKDLAGNALVNDYVWSFTTVAVDNTPPTVTSVSPANGTTGVSTGANVIANFSETINASTVTTTTFQLRDAGNNLIPASVSTSSGQVTLDPTSTLSGSTVYTATITGGASGVKDLAGNALVSNYSWSFTTVSVDITAPTVSSVSPANGTTGVSTGANVIANFSETINASTVTTTTFQLRDAGNNLIPASVSTSSGQITLDPTSTLAGSAVYTATITGGAPGVKDLAGNALVSNYSWSFTTVSVDITAPTVTSVSPVNGTTGVSTGANVIANFSEAINASTVTTATFQLRDAGNNLIPASVSTSSGQVTLDPTSTLAGSAVYTATITGGASGVKDLAGNALASNYSWSFTTIDNVPPTVSSVSPANGTTGVSTGSNIIANFSEAINASTVTTTTFQLRDAGNNLIPASVSTSSGQITLDPTSALANSIVYTATITGGASGVKDVAGNALASNYSWSFTTTASASQPVTIQSTNTKTGTAATVHPLTGVPAGALLVLATGADAVVSNCIVSSSPSLTWTKRVDAGAANSDNAEIWTAVYPAGGSITVTSSWGEGNSQASVCYVVLNAEPVLAGAFGTATLQAAPSVTITTTRENSIIFGCTADWKAINGATRTLRDAAIERLYFKDGNFTTYHYTKAAATIAAYTEGVSLPTGQQASTSLLEIRSAGGTAAIPPIVTTQPSTQTRCAGSNASFTSAASGTPAPTVQWQVSTNGTTWTNISGATIATLTIATTSADNNKQYRAAWTNSGGTVNSNPALLTVNPVPVLSSSLTTSAISGTSFIYTATSATSGTTFAWSRGAAAGISNPATGGTGNVNETLINTTTSPVNVTYAYTLTANSCANTQNVVVTVNTGVVSPTVTTQPTTQTRCAGTNASFTSAASGAPAPTVQWQVSTNGTTWTNITGATSSPLTFGTTTADNNKQYRAVWTNSGGPVNSNPAILTVNPMPVLSSNLTATATSGTAFIYTASSVTSGTTFTWSRAAVTGISNTATGGTGNINETLVNTTASPVNVTYVYTLTAAGCVNTQNLVVTVNTVGGIVAPTVTTQPSTQTRCAGINASFTSAASGSPAPTVQWQVSTNGTTWSNIAGATSVTLTFATTTADNNKRYRAVWTNSGGSVNSSPAILTVNPIPVLSSNLSATATTGTAFTYTATSTTTGTTFGWSRATVTGISNPATSGTGNINETLVNTTASPVNVTYVYTLTAAGCVNTQNVVVTVNPASAINCVINGSITSSFNSSSIPAGRYIWFNSVFDRGSFTGISGTVTFNVTNSRITFTANSQQYTLNVPNSRIRFDAAVTSATTQFINNVWETVVPRTYSSYVFMGGLAYQVPANLPGNISNVNWTATISIDKVGVSLTWRWAAAAYTSFAAHSGLNIKPKNGSTQNPYPNNDNAGTPENFKSFVVSGAKGSGGTNYTGSYSSTSTATCVVTPGQRSTAEPLITRQVFPKQVPSLAIDQLQNETLEVNAVPNPSNSIFNLIIKGSNKSPVQVRVTDVFGRIVERYEKISANTILQIGQRLRGGSYFVEVIQADQRKFVKIIKAN